jgi:TatD DNase family protein
LKLSDTHCHLFFDHYKDDLNKVLDHAWSIGVQKIVVPGIDIESSQAAIRLAVHDERIEAAVGIHPNSSKTWNNETKDKIMAMAAHPSVVAIGEIGLDYYRDRSPKEIQISALRQQLDIAKELNKPVILHNRNASQELFPMMLEWQQELQKNNHSLSHRPGVFHSFNENTSLMDQLIRAGFVFGISGPVTFTNAVALVDIVRELPLDKILIETDAPFLTPHPHRGQRNEPGYVEFIANKIAEIKSVKPNEVASMTYANAANLFSWSELH